MRSYALLFYKDWNLRWRQPMCYIGKSLVVEKLLYLRTREEES